MTGKTFIFWASGSGGSSRVGGRSEQGIEMAEWVVVEVRSPATD